MRIIALLSLIFITYSSKAQQAYTGMVSDNYVSSWVASYNPSSIVDSKSKFAVGMNMNFSSISNFRSKIHPFYAGFSSKSKYIESKKPGYINKYVSTEFLTLKYEINHQNALGFAFRMKTFSNLIGLPSVWAQNTVNDYGENIVNETQSIAGLALTNLAFAESSFTYARTIYDRESSLLKAGASLKILNGLDAKYFYANAGEVHFKDTVSKTIFATGVDADFAENFNNNQLFYKSTGVALDLGFTYESRPNYEEQYYEMDGAKRNVRYDMNKYKWKISGSITDIGWIRFMADSTYQNFTNPNASANAQNIIDANGIISFHHDPIFDSLQNPGVKSADQPTKFRMNIPTAFHGSFDMNVMKDFYVAYNMSIPLGLKDDKTRIKNFFIQTVTPRLEKENWSIMLPLSHMGNGKLYAGVAGRLQRKKLSIFAGMNNVSMMYGQKASMSKNYFAGVSYSVMYKVPDDVDHDLISDLKDDCPYDPGLAKFNGCPDTDGDGIIDKEDLCIYDKGPRSTNGCPDTDGDGIVDMNDMCPLEKGLGIHYGCPDRDKDGVIDAADRCPDVPGIELNNGCPFENQGCCLDDDGDGVTNNLDRCPGVSGSLYNNGCPIDSTNIHKIELQSEKDKKDANNTAQQIKDSDNISLKDEMVTSKAEMDSLMSDKNVIKDHAVYFDVDQASLSEKERKSLNKFIKDFPKNEQLEIVLIGYTDRDGSLDYNLILSKKRAETVKRKLVDFYGFDADDIIVYYYGETKSIHKGSYTKEQKAADRKVEIKLVKVSLEEE